MSASPAGPPSGPASTTPSGGPAGSVRRRKPTGPFAPKPRPAQRRPPGQAPPSKPANGAKPASSTAEPNSGQTVTPVSVPDPDDDPSLYSEYPLVTTKKQLLEGLRHHVMRFTTDREVNPYDPSEDQFQRPVRLQRRFPHDTAKDPVANATVNEEDDKEREKEAIRKAERQAEKEANQAQIAPTDKTATAKKRQQFKKKVEDVYFPTDTPEAQKRAKLRYEEGRPWHLEDFTGKNTWVGTYEEPLSETHAMFALDPNSQFRMVPLEKWYRFAPTGRYQTMNLDEAELLMNKKVKTSRFMKEADEKAAERRRAELTRHEKLNRGRVGERGERERSRGLEEGDGMKLDIANDIDEIDFEVDEEFQDDDEDKLFGEDEEAKDAERKIKEERHGANIFSGIKEEKDWYAEEEREKKKAAEERKKAKRTRKHLIKREKKFEYESESDHPYSESSDSEDSDEERAREEEERKKREESAAAKAANGGDSTMSGTDTPSSRAEKHANNDPAIRTKASMSNLKRPGSPNLSEASGSESSHKRIKKEHASSSSSGRMSPTASLRRNAGSGSDTEASGTERRPKKVRPHGSLAASPNGTPSASRSGTPVAATADIPTADEIKAVVPPQGISIGDLIAMFRERIPKARSKEFIAAVKEVAHTRGPEPSKLLYLK